MEEKLEFLQEIVSLKNKQIIVEKGTTERLSKLQQIEYKYHNILGKVDTLETYHVFFEEGNEPMFLLDNFSYHISKSTNSFNLKSKLVIKEGLVLKSYFFYLLTFVEEFKKTEIEPTYTKDLRWYETLSYGSGSQTIYNIAIPGVYKKIITPLHFGENIKINKKLSEGNKDLLGIKLIWHPFKETLFDFEEENLAHPKINNNVF